MTKTRFSFVVTAVPNFLAWNVCQCQTSYFFIISSHNFFLLWSFSPRPPFGPAKIGQFGRPTLFLLSKTSKKGVMMMSHMRIICNWYVKMLDSFLANHIYFLMNMCENSTRNWREVLVCISAIHSVMLKSKKFCIKSI